MLIVTLALAIASYATAGTVSLVVDPDDAKPSYGESDTITILIVGSGFAPPDGFCSLTINGGISTDNGGTASAPAVNTTYLPQLVQNGTANSGGSLIAGPITGTAGMGDLIGVPNWDGLGSSVSDKYAYSFEFHVPDLPESTIITIWLTDLNDGGGIQIFPPLTPTLELHITPEPMTIALLGLGGLFLRRRR